MNRNPAQNRNHNSRTSSGFTLIELLIVVSILGLLAALSLSVINVDRQRKVTEDAVRRANIEKLAQALESYCAAEGNCPLASKITFTGATAALASDVLTYVKQWPVGSLSTTVADIKYSYYADDVSSPKNFEVCVKEISSPSASPKYLRYNSSWGQIKECGNLPSGTWDVSCTQI